MYLHGEPEADAALRARFALQRLKRARPGSFAARAAEGTLKTLRRLAPAAVEKVAPTTKRAPLAWKVDLDKLRRLRQTQQATKTPLELAQERLRAAEAKQAAEAEASEARAKAAAIERETAAALAAEKAAAEASRAEAIKAAEAAARSVFRPAVEPGGSVLPSSGASSFFQPEMSPDSLTPDVGAEVPDLSQTKMSTQKTLIILTIVAAALPFVLRFLSKKR